jgi:hypothetical protein
MAEFPIWSILDMQQAGTESVFFTAVVRVTRL